MKGNTQQNFERLASVIDFSLIREDYHPFVFKKVIAHCELTINSTELSRFLTERGLLVNSTRNKRSYKLTDRFRKIHSENKLFEEFRIWKNGKKDNKVNKAVQNLVLDLFPASDKKDEIIKLAEELLKRLKELI